MGRSSAERSHGPDPRRLSRSMRGRSYSGTRGRIVGCSGPYEMADVNPSPSTPVGTLMVGIAPGLTRVTDDYLSSSPAGSRTSTPGFMTPTRCGRQARGARHLGHRRGGHHPWPCRPHRPARRGSRQLQRAGGLDVGHPPHLPDLRGGPRGAPGRGPHTRVGSLVVDWFIRPSSAESSTRTVLPWGPPTGSPTSCSSRRRSGDGGGVHHPRRGGPGRHHLPGGPPRLLHLELAGAGGSDPARGRRRLRRQGQLLRIPPP
jgi:hypothetical protein